MDKDMYNCELENTWRSMDETAFRVALLLWEENLPEDISKELADKLTSISERIDSLCDEMHDLLKAYEKEIKEV